MTKKANGTSGTKTNHAQPIEIKPEHAWCRGLTGHRWRPPSSLGLAKGRIVIALVCEGCKTTRVDEIDRETGLLDGRAYKYSVGYQTKGVGRQKAGTMRRLALVSIMEAHVVPVRPIVVQAK